MTADIDSTPTKACTNCGKLYPATPDFFPRDGARLRNSCKVCRNAQKRKATEKREQLSPIAREERLKKVRAYGMANRQSIMDYQRQWKAENPEHVKRKQREYYDANACAIRDRASAWKKSNPDRRLENNRRWAKENPEKSAESSRKNKARRMKVPISAFIERVRGLIAASIRNRGYTKRAKSHEILCCDWDFFKIHIERQFLNGMSWEKMGNEIHIDHIVPLATATTEAEVLALNHFTNLRPLWAAENLSKGAQITHLL